MTKPGTVIPLRREVEFARLGASAIYLTSTGAEIRCLSCGKAKPWEIGRLFDEMMAMANAFNENHAARCVVRH